MSGAVWITGIGTANPLGTSYRETAQRLLEGQSGIGRIERFDTARHQSKIAGLVPIIPVPVGYDPHTFEQRERIDRLALWCAMEALHDAGILGHQHDLRIGIVFGNGGEWLRNWESDYLAGGSRVSTPELDQLSLAQQLKLELGLSGPALTTGAACASGNYALAEARSWLRRGWVDVCIAGAVDLTVTPMGLSAFGNLRALSTKRNDEPSRASRPFDRDRDGFVVSEGGAVFLLERAETARRRGARAYAELAGFGASSDAYHLVIPGNESGPMAQAMNQAMREAGVSPSQLDYINAHATSTPVGDAGEARAIRTVLGESISSVAVSSTKGMTGHLIGAAAALETIALIAAFEHQAVPPTINLDELDPECAGLDHVAHEARPRRVEIAINNSFGFGGSNTSFVLRRV